MITMPGMPPISVPPPPLWPIPKFKLTIDDLDHEGADIFLTAVQPKVALRDAAIASFKHLYTPETVPTHVEQISLVLRSMEGVAYTCGSQKQKEIHFSLDYIKKSAKRARDEIMGILVHEVVHCYQYNACATCPGGLIEGIADFVRLREGLDPPHWKRTPGETWDAGYEKTGYFLDWIEERYGTGIIRELNASMKDTTYREAIFKDLTGRSIRELWNIYRGVTDSDSDKEESKGLPKFKLTINDLDHEGVDIFLSAVQPKEVLREAAIASFKHLYTPETAPTHVEQISLILRSMEGVAYTCGSQKEKEIHLSLDYIKKSVKRARDEIMGVLVHEVVHCYQYDACATCPGGLIEGIADFVRLREGLDPPHWTRTPGESWDAGYEKTGYFLDWIEERYGTGTIRELNASMKDTIYREAVFKDLTGRSVWKLWNIYRGVTDSDSDEASKGSTTASLVTIQQDETV